MPLDPELLELFAVLVSIGSAGGICFSLVAIGSAIAKRIERGRGPDPALVAEVESLRDRVAELERLGDEVEQLQERVDFAERLLIRRPDAAGLPGGER